MRFGALQLLANSAHTSSVPKRLFIACSFVSLLSAMIYDCLFCSYYLKKKNTRHAPIGPISSLGYAERNATLNIITYNIIFIIIMLLVTGDFV